MHVSINICVCITAFKFNGLYFYGGYFHFITLDFIIN